jgi:hypothetical protein
MKRRIYLIAALALINLVIMKYHEFRTEKRGSTWAMTGGEPGGSTDSFMTHGNR